MSWQKTVLRRAWWIVPASLLGLLFVTLTSGVVIGLVASSYLPQRDVQATATHGQENFAICTGPLDADVEAVFFLDFLTGDLKAAALSIVSHKFTAFYHRNILGDLEGAKVKNPRYLMVTGEADLRRGASSKRIGKSMVYVAEITSGQVMAYGLPWESGAQASNRQTHHNIVAIDRVVFRKSKKGSR